MAKLLSILALAAAAQAASLKDVKHVVLLMMENRSFQHYYGTLAGVRGFADPNVQINPNGKSVWYQNVSTLTNDTDWLLPYYLNYEHTEEMANKSQCLCAGANNWLPTQKAMQDGLMDKWALIDTPQAWGYFKRQDLPWHFALADAYTIGDAYHASITSNTDANRWFWQSGTINVPGGKTPLGSGGVVLDNNQENGCVGENLDCVPLKWPAFAQYLDEAGVDWRSYQNSWDWATNSGLFYFKAFQDADKNSSLYKRGLAFDGDNGLDAYKEAAAQGTLPEVSWAFPPGSLQEHPPNTPKDAAWFMNQVVDAAIHGKNAKETVVIINYDEGGGWGDAVKPIIPPKGTPGEWFEDPYGEVGYTFSGPGIRIPITLISPFTRGGKVFTERSDHSSILQFLEEYLAAKGYSNITATQMSDWRREHMSNLLNAFDFENPDYSVPDLPDLETPIANSDGQLIGMWNGLCSQTWSGACSGDNFHLPIPYGKQTEEEALFFEDGFRGMRGYMTEGHYLVFESHGHGLANRAGGLLGMIPNTLASLTALRDHSDIHQRWVVHALHEESTEFFIASAVDGRYMTANLGLTPHARAAEKFDIRYVGGGRYTIQKSNGDYVNIGPGGGLAFGREAIPYDVFSVTYHS